MYDPLKREEELDTTEHFVQRGRHPKNRDTGSNRGLAGILNRSADFVGNMLDPAGLPSWREVGEGAERFAKGGVNDAA